MIYYQLKKVPRDNHLGKNFSGHKKQVFLNISCIIDEVSILSWNSLPCSHHHTFSIATFYRPPATTISYDSTSSSPDKEIKSRNRLGTPPRRGVEKPEGPSALQPTTEYVHFKLSVLQIHKESSLFRFY